MEDSVKEVKTILQTLVDTALGKRAKNEKEEKEEKEDKKEVEKDVIVENEDVDKRDIIRQIMAIAGKREDDEDVRTIAKLAEKLAYDKSEAKTADNEDEEKDKKEKDEKEKKEDKKEAKNNEEEKPEEKEEKEQKYEDFKKEVAKETEKEVENCKAKAKNSLDELKAAFYEGTVKTDKKYMTQAQGIELGKELY